MGTTEETEHMYEVITDQELMPIRMITIAIQVQIIVMDMGTTIHTILEDIHQIGIRQVIATITGIMRILGPIDIVVGHQIGIGKFKLNKGKKSLNLIREYRIEVL